jgi:hypothetical protein
LCEAISLGYNPAVFVTITRNFRVKKIWIALPFVFLCACAATDIYFPAPAAKNAADRIISDVWQVKPAGVKGAK